MEQQLVGFQTRPTGATRARNGGDMMEGAEQREPRHATSNESGLDGLTPSNESQVSNEERSQDKTGWLVTCRSIKHAKQLESIY